MKKFKIKKLLIDVKPSMRYSIRTSEITPVFINELFSQTLFDYSDKINPKDIVDIIMMAYTYRMMQDFERRNINIRVALSPSIHPNYSRWLMLIDLEDPTVNIMPILANYFSWDRQETQNAMTVDDLFNL